MIPLDVWLFFEAHHITRLELKHKSVDSIELQRINNRHLLFGPSNVAMEGALTGIVLSDLSVTQNVTHVKYFKIFELRHYAPT